MEKAFDLLINSYIDNNIGIATDFLPALLSSALRTSLLALYADKQMLTAGTGNEQITDHNLAVRGDKTYWLDRAHDNPGELAFFELMDRFILHLNNTCYTGITGYEFHYTLYEAGTFYKKHLDQFRNNTSRQYSMILYLNPGWLPGDGGELCVHHAGYLQHIDPVNGKMIFFKSSELEHEVLMSYKPRMSITGWLSRV